METESKEVHEKDKKHIVAFMEKNIHDPLSLIFNTHALNYLEFRVDTIFYGPENKISTLVIAKRHNYWASEYYGTYEKGIEYYSFALIGKKVNADSLRIIKDLVYKISDSATYEEASKWIREV